MKKKILMLTIFVFILTVSFAGTKIEGAWFYYDDIANDGNSQIVVDGVQSKIWKFYKEVIDGEEEEISILGGYVTTKFRWGFLGMGVNIQGPSLEEVRNGAGVVFKAIGDPTNKCNIYRVRCETSNIGDYDFFGAKFTVKEDEVREFKVFYYKMPKDPVYEKNLKQEGWGQQKSFSPKLITQVSFQTVNQPYDKVLLKVWDLEVIPKGGE